MDVRSVVSRLLLGVAMAGVVAVIVFVGVPWLTSSASEPEPRALSSDEIVEQVLGPQAEEVVEAVDGMVLRGGAPEHPVMGLLGSSAEKGEAEAEVGEVPAPLSPQEVAGAISEFVRVASAPGDEFDEDDPARTGAESEPEGVVEAPAPVAPEARQPEVTAVDEPEAAPADETTGSVSPAKAPLAAVAVPASVDASIGGELPGIPLEAGIPEPGMELTAADGEPRDDARATAEVATPSGGHRERRAHEAGQVGQPQAGLPPLQEGVVVPYSLRGVMGYRLPLVSRQEVPDQVVSGVLIPGHTTYVILRQGEWELTGLSAAEVELLRLAAERAEGAEAEELAQGADDTESRGWRPFDLFRRKDPRGTR